VALGEAAPNVERRLIVNADDFGLSPGVNEGIIRSHEEGIVTSASLMVRQAAAAEAASYARRSPRLSVGLHLDLGEWEFRGAEWRIRYEVVPMDQSEAVEREVESQLDRFHDLVGTHPTHIDSHQHIHRDQPARSAVLAAASELRIPVRDMTEEIRYLGDFYGQDDTGNPLPELVSVAALVRRVSELPAGTTELGCHPGLDDKLPSAYGRERALEVEALCSREVKAAITEVNVSLISFRDVACSPLRAR